MTNPPNFQIYTGGLMQNLASLADGITKVLALHIAYTTTDEYMKPLVLCQSCFEEYPCRTVYVLRGDTA